MLKQSHLKRLKAVLNRLMSKKGRLNKTVINPQNNIKSPGDPKIEKQEKLRHLRARLVKLFDQQYGNKFFPNEEANLIDEVLSNFKTYFKIETSTEKNLIVIEIGRNKTEIFRPRGNGDPNSPWVSQENFNSFRDLENGTDNTRISKIYHFVALSLGYKGASLPLTTENRLQPTAKYIEKFGDLLPPNHEGNSNGLYEDAFPKKEIKKTKTSPLLLASFLIISLAAALIYFQSLPNKSVLVCNGTSEEPFQTDSTYFNILILPFTPVDQSFGRLSRPEYMLYSHFTDLIEETNASLEAKIALDDLYPIDFKKARSLGKCMQADMVIWGISDEGGINGGSTIQIKYSLIPDSTRNGKVRNRSSKSISPIQVHDFFTLNSAEVTDRISWIPLVELAVNAFNSGDFQTALTLSQASLSNMYRCCHRKMALVRAQSLNILGHYDEAIEEYETLLHDRPGPIEAHINFSTLLLERGKGPEAARDVMIQGIKNQPNFPYAHFQLALIYMDSLYQFHLAENSLLSAIELDPMNFKFRTNLAFLYQEKLHDIPRAQFQLKKAVEIDPSCSRCHSNLAYNYYKFLEKNELAETHFSKAIEIDPNNFAVLADYGLFLSTVRKDTANGFSMLRQAISIDPTSSSSTMLASLYSLYPTEAWRGQQLIERTIKRFPSENLLLVFLAESYMKTGNLAKSRELIQRYESSGGELAFARLTMAKLKERAGDLIGAENLYTEAIQITGGLFVMHLQRAKFYVRNKFYSKAIPELHLAMIGNTDKDFLNEARELLATTYRALGQEDSAAVYSSEN